MNQTCALESSTHTASFRVQEVEQQEVLWLEIVNYNLKWKSVD